MDISKESNLFKHFRSNLIDYLDEILTEQRKTDKEYDKLLLNCGEALKAIPNILLTENSPVQEYLDVDGVRITRENEIIYCQGLHDMADFLICFLLRH